jgi:hypothetical protein
VTVEVALGLYALRFDEKAINLGFAEQSSTLGRPLLVFETLSALPNGP